MSSSYPHKGRSGTASSYPREKTASRTILTLPPTNIPNVLWYMKKNGYADTTIKATGKRLRHLQAKCNLKDPEDVKAFIATKQCSNAHKESLVEAYDKLMQSINQKWNKPFYKRYDKLPKIPREEQINMLISNGSPRMSLFLSMSKDLGTRPIELTWLKVADIDLQSGVVNITGAKHTVGRNGKLRKATLQMLKIYITKKQLGQNDKLFPTTSKNMSAYYRRLRNKLSEKLQDPTIRQIRLYDFRHFKASMEYHKTKDLLHVKALLGHKDLRTTLRYTQLLDLNDSEDYHCKTASNIKEASNLIENGFEYVNTIDGIALYRKRK